MRFVVTGVTRGIGAEVARLLSGDGHEVWGVARPQSELPPGLAGGFRCDLSQPESIAAAASELTAVVDRLDGLVHSAGIVRGGSLEETTAENLTDQFAVNVTAAAEITRAFLPALRAARGTVVFVNSGSGLNARSPLGGYGASKFALRGYADALRREQPGIRVSSVYPGRTATDMQREVRTLEGAGFLAGDYLRVGTVAGVIVNTLLLSEDAVITDLVLRPFPGSKR
ncbi:MAG TPA: SDR family oxidoreductase [Propionibacteriaceae bacterium]|nr:SDR family oxidoreductase [Propionibacteriaceae bacterium]